jgi:2-polyprenyl-6-methoxyphenol hydroxylase-like FAD-dependent oxidoreductase
MQRHGKHAIVIGASVGGLVAAAALAPHFDRVTILERDQLPGAPAHRRGVPQSRHAHGLQPGGLVALNDLLPGLTEEFVKGGAPSGDVSNDVGWYLGGGWLARGNAGVRGVGLTRPYLEHTVRAKVMALPAVTVRDGAEVSGLVSELDDRGRIRVTGVELTSASHEQLSADLVVDASGRGSALPGWLRELGVPIPDEERVHCKMAYLSRRWQLADPASVPDIITLIAPAATPHFGVMIAQEDGTHIVTLGGLLSSGPARDDGAYREFAGNLPDRRIADALEGARPITELQPSHFPYSRRRRYDKLRSFPRGLLAIGDSIASFNPMYGQGMTVAAMEAVELRDQLRRGRLDARRFFKRAHRIEDVAWKIASGGDLRFEAVQGRRTAGMTFTNGYLERLMVAARTDPELARRFLRVSGFLDGPQALFRPAVISRVVSRRRAQPAVEPRRPAVRAAR